VRSAGPFRGSLCSVTRYHDRREAADALATRIQEVYGSVDPDAQDLPIVLGLPRGGVPVAARIAALLDWPWDVLIVRKVGAPDQPELAVGAVGEDGVEVRNDTTRGIFDEAAVQRATARERQRVGDRVEMFRQGRAMVDIAGRDAVIVDDGLATGTTMAAAIAVARAHGARRVVAAVPVGSVQAVQWMERLADEVICPVIPTSFISVGQHYEDFDQVSDAEVIDLLRRGQSLAERPSGV